LGRQNAENFFPHIAVLWLTGDDFRGLPFEPTSQRGIPSPDVRTMRDFCDGSWIGIHGAM
jgi:hypothetical protein